MLASECDDDNVFVCIILLWVQFQIKLSVLMFAKDCGDRHVFVFVYMTLLYFKSVKSFTLVVLIFICLVTINENITFWLWRLFKLASIRHVRLSSCV